MNIERIPMQLKKQNIWCVRNCKVPYNPKTNQPAKTNDINTFADFNTAYNAYINNNYDGIGLGIFGNLFAIDLDHCINNGILSENAELIVEAFHSYTEISPSESGLHIIGYIDSFDFDSTKYYINNHKLGIEIYISGTTSKYITMTGNKYNNFPIEKCQNSTMQKFLDNFMRKEVKKNKLLPATLYNDIDYLAIGLEKDEKLKAYYNGERPLASESENDAGFLAKLMYWCNNDTEKTLATFLSSPYTSQKDEYHIKKMKRKDYIDNLINFAWQEKTAYTDNIQYKERHKQSKSSNSTKKYALISAQDLQKEKLPPMKYLVSDILPEGTTILSAAPKIGKSWFVFDLALKLASNGVFLDNQTSQVGVLYLALEDGKRRLQERMNIILKGENPPSSLYFLTDVPNLDNGFFEFIEEIINNHNDIKLLIIDTLQKVRGQALSRETQYQHDYREMALIKKFADDKGISLLIVHHNRKMIDLADPFNMLSGTNGIMGAADTIFVMTKANRDDEDAQLHITGRDVEQSGMMIHFDNNKCTWQRIADLKELQEKEKLDNFLNNNIATVITHLIHKSDNGVWQGKAKALKAEGEKLHLKMPNDQKIGYEIRSLQNSLKTYGNIDYKPIQNGKSNSITHRFQLCKNSLKPL